MDEMLITTGDLDYTYDLLGIVYFHMDNKGVFSNDFETLRQKHRARLDWLRQNGQLQTEGLTQLNEAFYIALEEIKTRAGLLGANAVVFLRHDTDMSGSTFDDFRLQMYGTAIKFDPNES